MFMRFTLAGVFAASAALKVEYFLTGGAPSAGSLLGSAPALLIVVGVELAITIGLFTRLRVAAAYAAILVAVLGLYVAAHDSRLAASYACKCLGRARLSSGAHVLLSCCVFALAAGVILGQAASTQRTHESGQRTKEGRCSPGKP